MAQYDVLVIGAGAAGMYCAALAGQRGRRVLLIDHATRLGEKIRISGGGRCNFTNLHASPAQYLSDNPHYCRSALARHTPQDFLKRVRHHGIRWFEKHKGQLFCEDSSQRIIDLLQAECDDGRVDWRMPCSVTAVTPEAGGWAIATDQGTFEAPSLVVATGGMAIPKIGATDWGLRLAKQQGLPLVSPRPALVPLTFAREDWAPFAELAGVALEVMLRCNEGEFREDLLLTHRGLSGPAILQISSYWQHGDELVVDLLPEQDLAALLLEAKQGSRQQLLTVLSQLLPRRLTELWLQRHDLLGRALAEVSDKTLRQLAHGLQHWALRPDGSEGFRKAEVMRGGVDTRALDSRTMMARERSGLYFIGEVVDVTGWLGGYNFQWAWSSAFAAAQAV
ncbi:NAD(P)/FAD-dependent oxidoreductase [Leeia sp.]|uniref:NAD(P)/FAD-dependent oxidoreductase n=1 Tax=Leeia sp. TaxID=2884678 RepID=UPI0035B0D3C4